MIWNMRIVNTMKMTIENTTRIIEVDGVPACVWEGKTENGIDVYACIVRVVVHDDDDSSEFEADLKQCRAPSATAIEAFPLDMIL